MTEEIQNSLSGEAAAPTAAPAPAIPVRMPEAAVTPRKSAPAPMSGIERAMSAQADQMHKVTPRPAKVHPLSRK